jgi:hypothetical protein
MQVDLRDFDNVKGQIGRCGIWCGSCVVGNGTLKQLTGRYQKLIEAYGLRTWGPDDLDYDEFTKGLQSIQATPLCLGCLNGGGREECEIRLCASAKHADDCTECDAGSDCDHAEILEQMRSGALAAGLSVRSDRADRDELLKQWVAELASKWPCSLLFEDEG